MKKIVFLGGGHANILAIRSLIKKLIDDNVYNEFIQNYKFYLISEYDKSAYSGMIPGTICGYYTRDESFIDLIKFAEIHNCEFIQKSVQSLNPKYRKLKFQDDSEFEYDLLSINVGSTTFDGDKLKGAHEYALQTRPINQLLHKIETCDELIKEKLQITQGDNVNKISIGIIGCGVAGLELAFSLKYRYKEKLNIDCNATIFSKGNNFINEMEKNVRDQLYQLAMERNIKIIANSEVVEIKEDEILYRYNNDDNLSYRSLNFDLIVLATGAAPQPFNYNSQLSLNKQGFILVNNTLQSIDYSNIFSAGDCIQIDQYDNDDKIFPPKSGVYAVREAAILTENIYKFLTNKDELSQYTPQPSFLKLITMGDKLAFGTKFGIGFYGKWVWNLKQFIDVNFVKMFSKGLNNTIPSTYDKIKSNLEFSFDAKECYNKLINSSEENDFRIQLEIIDRLNSDSKLLDEIKKLI